jgi:hypothetical protein
VEFTITQLGLWYGEKLLHNISPLDEFASWQKVRIKYENSKNRRAEFSPLFIWREENEMDLDIFRYFLTQGPFAVLFVWLLIYVMKNNKERENRLQDLLDRFSEKYDLVITGGNGE